MRIVQVREGRLEIRWTWLPFWLGQNPKLKSSIEREMRDAVLVNALTTSDADLDSLHDFVVARICALFPLKGLDAVLNALRQIEEH